MADAEIIKKVKEYIIVLNNAGIPVKKAYLYGSCAFGKGTAESDIDVLIVSDVFNEFNDKMISKAWLLIEKVDTRIEPNVIGYQRFISNELSPFIQMIVEKGIEIMTES